MLRYCTQLSFKTSSNMSGLCWMQGDSVMRKHCGTVFTRLCTSRYPIALSVSSRPCQRCGEWHAQQKGAGGAMLTSGATSSHGLALGRGRQWWCGQEMTLPRRGSNTMRMTGQWSSWRWSDWRRDSGWRTCCLRHGTSWWSTPLMPQGARQWTTYAGHSEDGNKGMIFGGTPSLLFLGDRRHGGVQEDEHKGLWQHGCYTYRTTRSSTWQPHASHVATRQGGFVQIADWLSAKAVPEQGEKISVVKKVEHKAWLADMSYLQSDLVRRRHSSSEGSSDNLPPVQLQTLERQGGGHLRQQLALLCGLVGLWFGSAKKSTQAHCAGRNLGDEPDSLATSASSSRGAPSQSVGPARWAATTSLELAARERVLSWRLEHGLEDDSDFGFRWSSHEEAVASAGHAIAHEWLRVRADQRDSLLHTVAKVIDELPRPGPTVAPAILRETRGKQKSTMFGRKRQGARLKANPSDAPDAITARVDALTGVMMRLGALAPSGTMTPSLQAEWHQACTRLSQRLITNAERSTVLNAITTAEELKKFMRSRDRGCLPDKVDLDAFLHAKTTQAPVRALASLKWLNNNGQLGWSLQDLAPPTGRRARRTRGSQAVVIAPPMLAVTEETIERTQRTGNEKWTALLGCWMISTGCLRYRHIQRASPKRLSISTMHCFCWRGKQKANRTGFYFSVPSEFGSGFQWTKPWLELYLSLGETQRQRAGLCFDRQGAPWAISEINAIAQEVFGPSMDNVEALTTYSFRRWGPTFGQSLALTPLELNALGDWQAKGETPRDAVMPLHYSSARYAESMKMKHLLLLCSPSICEYEAWEVIPPSVLREAKTQGRKDLDRQVHGDIQTVWAQPISPGEALTKFKLSKSMMARAAQLKQRAARAAEVRAMPATLGDKVLSAFLKNGETLCGAYQIHRCGRSDEQCDALHKCAVVLRSARVCGGRHAASDCHDKRYLKADNQTPTKKEEVALPLAKEGRLPKSRKKEAGSSTAKEGRLPQPKKRPQPKSPDHPPPAKRARSEPPVVDNSQDEALYDRLATTKGKTAQKPTLILRSANGGAIWLSGLPTVATLGAFPAVSLQVCCFSEPLERRGGVRCPGAQCLVMAPTDKERRDDQWKELWPLLRQTYLGGESILIHCMAGRHRAAGIAVLVRSLLKDCTIEESDSVISAQRDIEFNKLVSTKHVADWIWCTYRHASVGSALPQLDGYMATERSQLHIRTVHDTPLCHHKQSSEKAAERLKSPLRTSSLQEAVAWGRPWCSACLAKAPAGVQTMIRDC